MGLFYDSTKINPEMELIRNYLNKDHKYRNGEFDIKWQGLVDDNFGASSYLESFASSGWRNLGSLMGKNSTAKADYIESLKNDTYLWSYGCGGGTYQSAGGIGTSEQISKSQLHGIYSMLFGSYFGDWDSKNNFLRAPLATSPSMLTNAWVGRPHWYFHHMGINFPIAYSALLSFKVMANYRPNFVYTAQYPNGIIYATAMRNNHIALMGDPTLRMFAYDIPAPNNLVASVDVKGLANLQWKSPDENQKFYYNIYRATEEFGLYTKVNKEPISTNTFIDSTFKYDGVAYYSVRTTALDTSNTATFYNNSKGIFASVSLTSVNQSIDNSLNMQIYPNPSSANINVELNIPSPDTYSLALYDLMGNLQIQLLDKYFNQGIFRFNYNLNSLHSISLSNGIYILQLKSSDNIIIRKLYLIK